MKNKKNQNCDCPCREYWTTKCSVEYKTECKQLYTHRECKKIPVEKPRQLQNWIHFEFWRQSIYGNISHGKLAICHLKNGKQRGCVISFKKVEFIFCLQKKHMTTHMKNKHGGQTFECVPCDKKFACKVSKKYHIGLNLSKVKALPISQRLHNTHTFQAYLTSHQKSSCKERFRKMREMNAQRAALLAGKQEQ